MKSDIKQQCNTCGNEVATYDGIYISTRDDKSFLCSKCYNESISKATGLTFDHLSFHPIDMEDREGKNHTFHIQTRLFGDKVNIQALEIREGKPKGYKFSENGDAEGDLFDLFSKLVDRIRRELERSHIEPSELTRYRISNDDIVRGQIKWDDDTDGQVPCLVIDGKELSWHEFGRMLMAYEGFHFKLEIFEGTEER
ncbi:hypothetical protein ACFL0Q_01765 [Thermodesulfobacteriota bacterium]